MIEPFARHSVTVRLLLLLALMAGVLILPMIIYRFDLAFHNGMLGRVPTLLDFFRFSGGVAILLLVHDQLRQDRSRVIEAVGFAFVALIGLAIVTSQFERSWDYQAYENAAQVYRAGGNPYILGYYLYPPLTVQLFAGAASVLQTSLALPDAARWDTLFYVFVGGQWFVWMFLLLLVYRFCKDRGLETARAAGLAGAAVLLNAPVLSTIAHHQMGLVILVAAFVVMMYRTRWWVLAAVVLALAIHIKLYPVLLLLPLLIGREYKMVLATLAATAVLLGVSLLQGGIDLYRQYAGFSSTFPVGTHPVQNCIPSVLINFSGQAVSPVLAKYVHLILSIPIVGWLWMRMRERWRLHQADSTLLNCADSLAIGILLTPIAYDHHYVLILPIALMTITRMKRWDDLSTLLALTLIFAIPTFDVFPFSYHRIAGLIWLLVLTRPVRDLAREHTSSTSFRA